MQAKELSISPWLGVAAIFALAFFLRWIGIESESFFVDEAFTASASRGSAAHILETNARDIHPPAYYLGLKLWRDWLSGSDVVMRGYSCLWSLIGIGLLMRFAKDLAGPRTALLVGLLAAVNPLDIYFAQEARMYAQTTALGIASAWMLWRWWNASVCGEGWREWWREALAYVAIGFALLMTHYVSVTFLLGQGCVVLALFAWRRDWHSVVGYLLASLGVALAFLPWLLYVLHFRDSIVRPEGLDWMPFPGISDYFSFLGREFFWGRARHIHEQWWVTTLVVPLVVLSGGAFACWRRSIVGTGGERRGRLFFLLGHLAAPLIVCAIVSASYQVIYYRPRYVVILLPYFLLLIALACQALPARSWRALAVSAVAGLMLMGSAVQHWTPQKRAWRETAAAWPKLDPPAFYVVFPSFHVRSLSHHLGGTIEHTPREVLERLMPLPEDALIWVLNWPEDLSPADAAYRDWLQGVGLARHLTLPTHYSITQVEPHGEPASAFVEASHGGAPRKQQFRPFDLRGRISGFSDARRFGRIEFDAAGLPFRRSKDVAWLRLDSVPAESEIVIRSLLETGAEAPRLFIKRGADLQGLFEMPPLVPDGEVASGLHDLRLQAPAGQGPVWVGWTLVDPPAASPMDDDRPALRVRWVAIEPAPKSPRRVAATERSAED